MKDFIKKKLDLFLCKVKKKKKKKVILVYKKN